MGVFFIVSSLALYGTFLLLQATRHRRFSPRTPPPPTRSRMPCPPASLTRLPLRPPSPLHAPHRAAFQEARRRGRVRHRQGRRTPGPGRFPRRHPGARPEALAALHAALANQLQRTVNIALGSALATIGLTVPTVLTLGYFAGLRVEMGLEPPEILLLMTTFLVVLLAGYVVLIFDR
jgi:hypothetical protein